MPPPIESDNTMVTIDVYRRRRQKLLNALGDGLLALPTAPLVLRNGDVFHAFRPDSNFYYLTGFSEPESVLVAWRVDARKHVAILFVQPRDPGREIWDGPRVGVRGALRHYGMDEAFPSEKLYERLEALLEGTSRLFYTLGRDGEMDQALQRIFERVALTNYRGNPRAHPTVKDPLPTIATLRLTKDRDELEVLSRAAAVTASGHLAAMRSARPGLMEYELQAELEAAFRRGGSRRNGYESIVASGANACILHYVNNDRRMRSGDLVLIDAGAELDMYTADVTRTFPVSGRFTLEQREVYQIVLRAQKAAVRNTRSGRAWTAPHRAAQRVIVDGLKALGILRGAPARLPKKEAYRPWFMHGTSHWLGMDVHDVGGYQDGDEKPFKLRPGMVLTIEPGLYFSPRDQRVPKRYRGIGVRIEDDVLVTRNGPRVLTAGVPKEVKDVEAACAETSG